MTNAISILIQAIDQATAPIRAFKNNLHTALSQLQNEAQAFHRSMERATNLRFASQAVGELGRKATAALLAPVKSAADFETAMAGVNKVVDFKSPDGLEALGKELRALSLVIPVPAAGLADIAAAGGQFGLPEDKLRSFTEMTAKVAVAWDILPDQAGESIAKLSNIFQIPIEDTQQLTDTINALSNEAAAEAPQIVAALLRMGGNSELFGLMRGEAVALATSLIELGRPPEVAARAINTLLSRLQTADAQGKKFQSAMKFMGLSSKEFKDSIEKDAGGALLDFLSRLESLDNANRAKALTFLFGEGFSDEIGILVGSLDKYRTNLQRAADEQKIAGSVGSEFGKQAATTNNGFILLTNTLAELKTTLGNALLPHVQTLVSLLKGGTKIVIGFAEMFPMLTKGLLIATAAIGGVLMVLSPILLGIAGLTIVFGGGGAALAGMGAAAAAAVPGLMGVLAVIKPLVVAVVGLFAAFEAGKAVGTGLNNLPKLFGSKRRFTDMGLDLFMDDYDPNAPSPALGPAVKTANQARGGRNRGSDFNGKVAITIDSEGRPRVKQLKSDRDDVEMVADVGMIMAQGM